MVWRPWSALFLKHTRMFMLAAEQQAMGERVAKVAGVPSAVEFKKRFKERAPRLRELFRNGLWH
jgi:hypothetical protein